MASYQGGSKDTLKAYALIKQREKEKEEIQKRKEVITKNLQLTGMNNKFVSYTETLEDEMRSNIVGLVTLDEMRKKQERLIKDKEIKIITETLKLDSDGAHDANFATKRTSSSGASTKTIPHKKHMLSFEMDEDFSENESDGVMTYDKNTFKSCSLSYIPKKISKNPEADISYLPDKDRVQKERLERERLINEWIELNKKIKDERVMISYMYWDGSGHRKSCCITKGATVENLLQLCLANLQDEFLDLKGVSVEKLMFIKEDLIIPHHYNIYDFIVNKYKNDENDAQIFNFDNPINKNNPDMPQIEKAEALPAKVCLRSWYNRNKHIYPANLWKPFDPDRCAK